MNTTDSIQQNIYDVILMVIPYIDAEELLEDTDIFSLGLDSVNAMRLILHLQTEFGIRFSTADINFENFKTIANIARTIEQKIAPEPIFV
ncbi:MAG: acyl carrier protein [Geitlerinemataceae cyanobacterium]